MGQNGSRFMVLIKSLLLGHQYKHQCKAHRQWLSYGRGRDEDGKSRLIEKDIVACTEGALTHGNKSAATTLLWGKACLYLRMERLKCKRFPVWELYVKYCEFRWWKYVIRGVNVTRPMMNLPTVRAFLPNWPLYGLIRLNGRASENIFSKNKMFGSGLSSQSDQRNAH